MSLIRRVKEYKRVLEKAIRDEKGEKSILNLGDSIYCIFLSFKDRKGLEDISAGVEVIVREIKSEYWGERMEPPLIEILDKKRKEIRKKSFILPLAFYGLGGLSALACYELALYSSLPPKISYLISLGNLISNLIGGSFGSYVYYKTEMGRFKRKLVNWGGRVLGYVNEFLERTKK